MPVTTLQIETHGKLKSAISTLHIEMSALSKSKPDNLLNAFKVGLINQQLRAANALLPKKFLPLENFEVFDETKLPTNSDVVMVLSQYLNALEAWRSANVIRSGISNYVWQTECGKDIHTGRPTVFSESI